MKEYIDKKIQQKFKKINFSRIYLNFSLFILFFVLLFPNTGLIDRLYALFLILFTFFFIKKPLEALSYSAPALLYLSIAVSFAFSLDKVIHYPQNKHIELLLILYFFALFIHVPIIKGLFNSRSRIFCVLSLVIIYSSVIRIPIDLTRQLVGNLLTNHEEPVYFTKIHNNIIIGVHVHDSGSTISFKPSGEGFTHKYEYPLHRGIMGSMDPQYIDQTLTFKFFEWIHKKDK